MTEIGIDAILIVGQPRQTDVLGVFAVHRLRKGALSSFLCNNVGKDAGRTRSIDSCSARKPAYVGHIVREWKGYGRSTRGTVIEFSWPVITGAIDTNLYAGDLYASVHHASCFCNALILMIRGRCSSFLFYPRDDRLPSIC